MCFLLRGGKVMYMKWGADAQVSPITHVLALLYASISEPLRTPEYGARPGISYRAATPNTLVCCTETNCVCGGCCRTTRLLAITPYTLPFSTATHRGWQVRACVCVPQYSRTLTLVKRPGSTLTPWSTKLIPNA